MHSRRSSAWLRLSAVYTASRVHGAGIMVGQDWILGTKNTFIIPLGRPDAYKYAAQVECESPYRRLGPGGGLGEGLSTLLVVNELLLDASSFYSSLTMAGDLSTLHINAPLSGGRPASAAAQSAV